LKKFFPDWTRYGPSTTQVRSRLNWLQIVRTEFPIPILPPEPPPIQLGSPLGGPSSQDSTTSNKENAPAKPRSPVSRPPVPSFTGPSDSTAQKDNDLPADYPPDLAALHKSIQKALKNGFPRYPPYTVQRLVELILYPKKHYRFLPSYLHALDRVISVQSTTELFPLPQATLPSSHGMLNGVSATPASTRPVPELGSDESLGGALLTPIPWLNNRTNSQQSTGSSSAAGNEKELQTSSTEMVEGPNGAGRIETVNVVNGVMTPVTGQAAHGVGFPSRQGQTTEETLRAEGAVTQGELLRQEQEAGVVPVQPRGLRMSEEEMGEMAVEEVTTITEEEEEAERPHATGPEEIGDEDIGLQSRPMGGVLDLEAAVGRSRRDASVDPEDASLSDAGGGREEDMRDADEAGPLTVALNTKDVDIADADGKAEDATAAANEEKK
jgi:hypothetical protein